MKPELKYNLGKAYYADGATPQNLAGAVSKSMLWRFNESPYKWRFGSPAKPSAAMDFGSLVHDLTLSASLVNDLYAVNTEFDDFRTKAAREWRDEQAANGKTVVTKKDMDIAMEISDLIEFELTGAFVDMSYEVAAYGAIGNTTVKGMIDIIPKESNMIVDLKTIDSIKSERNLNNVIWERGYHWQAALYLDLYTAATGENREQFQFIFIETSRPFEVVWVDMPKDLIDLGRAGYMNAIAKWQKCLATNVWPGTIPAGRITASTPKWATINE